MKTHVVKIRGERRWYEAGQLSDPVFTALRSIAYEFRSLNAARSLAQDMPVACDVIEVGGEADR